MSHDSSMLIIESALPHEMTDTSQENEQLALVKKCEPQRPLRCRKWDRAEIGNGDEWDMNDKYNDNI